LWISILQPVILKCALQIISYSYKYNFPCKRCQVVWMEGATSCLGQSSVFSLTESQYFMTDPIGLYKLKYETFIFETLLGVHEPNMQWPFSIFML